MLPKKGEVDADDTFEDASDEAACRICWDAGQEALLSPCLCRGSMSQVHLSCLQSMYGASEWRHVTCSICKHPFECLIHAARKKELSSMTKDNLKKVADASGLKTRAKATSSQLVASILAHEARERAEVTMRKVNMRAVVSQKKAALEFLDITELKQLCVDIGVREKMSHGDYVEKLLTHWQQTNGIEKALNKLADDARKNELFHLEKVELRAMCDEIGENPLVDEVLIERLIAKETKDGHFSRPQPSRDQTPFMDESRSEGILAAIFARQVALNKKKEFECKASDVIEKKRTALETMTLAELAKKCDRRGLDYRKKHITKTDLKRMLLEEEKKSGEVDKVIAMEAKRQRRDELSAMDKPELHALCQDHGVDMLVKEIMVERIFWHEDRKRRRIASTGGA